MKPALKFLKLYLYLYLYDFIGLLLDCNRLPCVKNKSLDVFKEIFLTYILQHYFNRSQNKCTEDKDCKENAPCCSRLAPLTGSTIWREKKKISDFKIRNQI